MHIKTLVNKALLTTFAFTFTSLLQNAQAMPPETYTMGPMGVDLGTGAYTASREDISVGPAGSPDSLSFVRQYNSLETRIGPLATGWSHNLEIRALRQTISGSIVVFVNAGMSTVRFTKSGSTYTADRGGGQQLISSTVSGLEHLEYISRDGTKIKFSPINTANCSNTALDCNFRGDTLTKPNSDQLIFSYASNGNLMSVNSALGWNLSFQYNANNRIISVQAVNLADTYCAPAYGGPAYCNLANWPKVTYGYATTFDQQLVTVTDTQGNTSTYGYDANYRFWYFRRPNSGTTNDRTINYNAAGQVASAYQRGYGSWLYTYTSTQVTVRNPLSQNTVVYFGTEDQPLWMEDALGRRTTFTYDTQSRLKRQTNAEGDYVEFTYDTRGNVTQTVRAAKPGSGLASIVTTAGFPASCSTTDAARCNKPIWTKDAKGNQTDYTYNSSSNGPATITFPAGDNGIRPQQRFAYQALYAYKKTSSGGYVQGSRAVYRLTETAACQTLASCSGGADEVKTTFGYGATNVANNRAVLQVIQDPSGLALTTATTYDRYGNVATIDGPLAGTADTTYFRYDTERRQVGVINPDPDGAGALKRPATRITYDIDGLPTLAELGTVTGTTDTAWNAFVTLQAQKTYYDVAGRVWQQRAQVNNQSGAIVYAFQQYTYDALGRTLCAATRMGDPVSIPVPPSSACTRATPGSFGEDRISRFEYDAAGQLTKTISAYGVTGVQQDTTTNTYTLNGQLATLRDARGNVTTYEYDGHGRLVKLRYPHKTTIGTSSTTDYESYVYDVNGNVTSLRKRDGQLIGFVYDNLNRVTKKDLPTTTTNDVYYAYDLLGRNLSARYGSQSGSGIINVYDKAGRLTSTSSYGRTLSYLYDTASRRTRMTHPDGYWVQYDYDVLDRVKAVREYGAASGVGVLASYSYDDLGRRTSITRGNGVTTSFGFDPISRLNSLTHNASGTAQDFTATFSYNPASQIVERTQVNDTVYTWTGQTVGTVSGSFNGQNQPTTLGGKTITHDANGNVTGDGTSTFAYDVENKLTQVSGGSSVTLSYDPLGRLRQTVSGANTTQFLYDGGDLVVEYNATGTVLRRYVHGPGVDEPLVWYEGAGTTTRKWLHADERGSVVAVTNSSGTVVETHTYGPYGEPSSMAGSRFQYTGQIAIPEAGLYYYKARIYSPSIGRFLQTDPLGYVDGPNLYAYVGGDPINATDPSGLVGENSCGSRIDGNHAVGCVTVTDNSGVGDANYGRFGGGFSAGGGTSTGNSNSGSSTPPTSSGMEDPLGSNSTPFPTFEGIENIVVTGSPSSIGFSSDYFDSLMLFGSPEGFYGDDAYGLTVAMFGEEHTKNARPSTKGKHQKGRARVEKDGGGEKGDKNRRLPRSKPRGWRGPWPPIPRIFPLLIFPPSFHYEMQEFDRMMECQEKGGEACKIST